MFASKYSNELPEYVFDSFDALMVGCALEDVRLLLVMLRGATRVSASSAPRTAQRVRMMRVEGVRMVRIECVRCLGVERIVSSRGGRRYATASMRTGSAWREKYQ